MRPKCITCKSCLDPVWIHNSVYWHCWLCDIYYKTELGNRNLLLVDKDFINHEIEISTT